MDEVSFSVIGGGEAGFLRAFTIPLAEELERTPGLSRKPIPAIPLVAHDSRPKAIELPIAGIVGVLLFLPGWFALKVLNEVYDIKIKPVVRKVIEKADSIEVFASTKQFKVFTLEVFVEDRSVLIVLAAKEKALHALIGAVEHLPDLLPQALRFVEGHESKNEVHVYVLSEGQVNVVPSIHDNVKSAYREFT